MVKSKPVDALKALTVLMESIETHPESARRGDITMLMSSLATHGQYRPIVVNARDNRILKGNNTYLAAQKLGWKKIAAVMIDVDEDHARRIILSDNRTSDLASYDTSVLAGILLSLPDLDGTGFDASDIEGLDSPEPQVDIEPPKEIGRGGRQKESSFVEVKVGPFCWGVDGDMIEGWESSVVTEAKEVKAQAVRIVRSRLGFPPEAKKKRKPKADGDVETILDVEVVPIDLLIPWEPNPREGDIGSISESLTVNGQYAPLVVQAGTNRVIAGNHTLRAAQWLGWTEISVTFIDVSDDDATRIMLIDNRSSDVSEYDGEVLKASLLRLSSFDGTGFSDDDVDDIFKGYSTKPNPKQRRGVRVSVNNIRFTVKREVFTQWAENLPLEKVEMELADRLGIPHESCEFPQ
jgi:ParB-like chromosome segregation protein Spo0J